MAKIWLFSFIAYQFLIITYSTRITCTDFAALRQIKNSLTDIPSSAPTFFSTWDFSSPNNPCSSFSGVTCSTAHVFILTLGPGLAGTLSPAISHLSHLTQLILFPGIVTGPIPPHLSSLHNLRVLSLTNNRLTGPIPPEILRLPNLHTLDLTGNQLSGVIPLPIVVHFLLFIG